MELCNPLRAVPVGGFHAVDHCADMFLQAHYVSIVHGPLQFVYLVIMDSLSGGEILKIENLKIADLPFAFVEKLQYVFGLEIAQVERYPVAGPQPGQTVKQLAGRQFEQIWNIGTFPGYVRVGNPGVLRRPQEAIHQCLRIKLVHLVNKRGDFIAFLDGGRSEAGPQLFNPRLHCRKQVVINELCQMKYRGLPRAGE